MPPRKRYAHNTIPWKAPGTARKSARISKESSDIRDIPLSNDSSSDELSSQRILTHRDGKLKELEVPVPQEDIVDEIIVSHPRRITPTPVPTKKGTLDVPNPGDEEDELAGEAPLVKRPRPTITIVTRDTPSRKSRSKYDNPDEMLTNPRAPLATANLRDLLCSSKAWDLLDPEEKQEILSKFPDQKDILDVGTENARPDIQALRNNDNFRNDIARYQEDLSKGCHDPEWIQQARSAHRKRELGFYNDFLAARFEEEWDMKMPGQERDDSDDGIRKTDEADEEQQGTEMSTQEDSALKSCDGEYSDKMSVQEGSSQKEGVGEHSDTMSTQEHGSIEVSQESRSDIVMALGDSE
ncbi:Asx homology domain-containing protein [Durotheca rogersii]|uniref:Asx homology domain-containing protein n=1 Tax=Durotheca rogersii TaxID=419775 RepID=UPI0022202999|nr:Asx homology domain-containing protein [Durotheca rogersii]KAI5865545.1 Asx homology domain-containing protein [Durotheca rogersii]